VICLTGFLARIPGAIIRPSSWVWELTGAINSRKGRMEDYASLVHKSSEYLLPVIVVEKYLSVYFICRRAPKFEGRVGNAGAIFGICF
jgi:hypothetical protein